MYASVQTRLEALRATALRTHYAQTVLKGLETSARRVVQIRTEAAAAVHRCAVAVVAAARFPWDAVVGWLAATRAYAADRTRARLAAFWSCGVSVAAHTISFGAGVLAVAREVSPTLTSSADLCSETALPYLARASRVAAAVDTWTLRGRGKRLLVAMEAAIQAELLELQHRRAMAVMGLPSVWSSLSDEPLLPSAFESVVTTPTSELSEPEIDTCDASLHQVGLRHFGR